jgi:quercetin dioxygenase-like cupin family protein
MGYTKVNLKELDPAGPGGAVRFVRRELGLEAFGINWFDLPPNSEGNYHDEKDSGQEEVNVIVRGSGVYVIDGEEVQAAEGDVFRFDPETERGPKAGPDGLTMVAVGARRGSYEPRGPF